LERALRCGSALFRPLGGFSLARTIGTLGDTLTLLKLGFADKIINTPEHPYVMQLRGLAE